MRRRLKGISLAVPLALVALLGASASWAQTQEIDQKLDQVYAFDADDVLDMAFTNPNVIDAVVPDFDDLGLIRSDGLASCKLAPRGLYCLATASSGAQVVRFWKDPKARPLESSDLLRCDSLPKVNSTDTTAGQCVSLTVDLSGAIWVSATNGIGYSLFKVATPKEFDPNAAMTVCPSSAPPAPQKVGTSTDGQTPLCAKSFASGKGVLSDLHPVDGQDVAGSTELWPFGYGILALRNGVGSEGEPVVLGSAGKPVSETLFFGLHAPTIVARNFGSWNLIAGERLLSTSLLQVPKTDGVTNYILATTNSRKVAARSVPATGTGSNSIAFDIKEWEEDPKNSGPASVTLGGFADWNFCNSKPSCVLDGATITAPVGSLAVKRGLSDAVVGLGVGPSGTPGVIGEIDGNESIRVDLPAARKVSAIQILFLFNGPEFNDPKEAVTVTAVDGAGVSTFYTLQTNGNDPSLSADTGTATWTGPGTVSTGPGTVSKCGTMTDTGTGCFLISNPFPGLVKTLTFNAKTVPLNTSNNSDFSIGLIETVNYVVRTSPTTGRTYLSNRDFQRVLALENAAPTTPVTAPLKLAETAGGLELALFTSPTFPDGITVAPGNRIDVTEECDNPIDATSGNGGCTLVPGKGTKVAAKFGNVKLADTTVSGIEVFQVTGIPDCRQLTLTDVCYKLFAPNGVANTRELQTDELIRQGVIVPLASPGTAAYYQPAAMLLNVTPLLPEDVTSKFELNDDPKKGGLPNLFISNRYRGAKLYDHYFGGVFIKAQDGIKFKETFSGEFDIAELRGNATVLGCDDTNSMPTLTSELLLWDTITRVSETHKSVAFKGAGNSTVLSDGKPVNYYDSLINVGCRNPIKTVVSETSFFPYLEISPDTYGRTVKSGEAWRVTTNNDGVFARLVQTLYGELNDSRNSYACAANDGQSTAPISSSAVCSNLAKLWSSGKQKLDKCVDAAFQPKSSASNENCQSFRNQFDAYKAALPATTSAGADPANRLGEQRARWEVIKHVFETRFLPSIPANGYVAERSQ